MKWRWPWAWRLRWPQPVTISLRSRLLLWLLLPILFVFVCSGLLGYYLVLYFARAEYDQSLYDHVHSLAQLVEKHGRRVSLNMPRQAKRLFLWDDLDTTYYQIVGERTGFIAGQKLFPGMPATGLQRFYDTLIYDADLQGTPVRVAALWIDHPELGQRVLVQVAETQFRRESLAGNILLTLLVPQFLLIVIVVVVVGFGVDRSLRPLAVMAKALDAQTHYRISAISDAGSPREVRPLVRAINELLKRLDLALEAQRKFIANAAHQLRTPLTAIKLNVQRLRTEPEGQGRERALLHLQASAERAIRLSNQLLALARAEHGAQQQEALLPVDLCAVALEAGMEWVPLALMEDVELSFEGDEETPVPVLAHALLLREAISNLIDNAIKYGAHPGRVVLSVQAEPVPSLTVADNGPGIAEADQVRVFERFFRSDQEGEGSGLGLAIVKDIAALHQATITLAAGLDGQGLAVSLRFPPIAASAVVMPAGLPPIVPDRSPVAVDDRRYTAGDA